MKKSLYLFLLSFSFSSLAAITVVSDLENTISINGLTGTLSDQVYTSMPEVLNASRHYAGQVDIMSHTVALMRGKISKTLEKQNIRVDNIILRSVLVNQPEKTFKINELKKLISRSGDDFILIGDDVGEDPEVFDEIKKLYPQRILAGYVHLVKGRVLPQSLIGYYTGFDLVLREFAAGRMSDSGVKEVYQKLMEEQDLKKVFPVLTQCPINPKTYLWHLTTPYRKESLALSKKFYAFCLSRLPGL